ncbi:MAG: VanZ family protein [Alloprevotella sp.]|nr:VanZ family protein [Alloprevotella sp.]
MRRYPLSTACIVLILVLSFVHTPHTKLDDVSNIDKVAHFLMYFLTGCVIWWEYARRHSRADVLRLLLLAVAAPILMSGGIELGQEFLTGYRGGEWADFAANALGVITAACVGRAYIFPRFRR